MDSGAVLAARDEYGQYAPASTIKVLLALTVLDELPLDTTVVANEADTKVECNCAGVAPGRPTPPASCSRRCCWCRATTPPTHWPPCSAARTSPS